MNTNQNRGVDEIKSKIADSTYIISVALSITYDALSSITKAQDVIELQRGGNIAIQIVNKTIVNLLYNLDEEQQVLIYDLLQAMKKHTEFSINIDIAGADMYYVIELSDIDPPDSPPNNDENPSGPSENEPGVTFEEINQKPLKVMSATAG